MKRCAIGTVTLALLCVVVVAATAGAAADHPLVKVVEAHKAAKRAGDIDAVKLLQAEGARIWFEEKKGEGAPLGVGGGPWVAWDRFFNATSEVLGEYDVREGTVSARIHETNDYYRLLDRPGGVYRATYYFDENDRIVGVLIDSSGETRDPGGYDEFVAWARDRRPGLLETLMPDDRIDPALPKAKLWKTALVEWRADAGLPPIE